MLTISPEEALGFFRLIVVAAFAILAVGFITAGVYWLWRQVLKSDSLDNSAFFDRQTLQEIEDLVGGDSSVSLVERVRLLVQKAG